MTETHAPPLENEKKQRLLVIFERLLPLVDALADKLKLMALLGLLVTVWLVVWMFYFKQFSIFGTFLTALLSFFPTLILIRFWWSLEELKDLPQIAERMAGDAKSEFKASLQNIRLDKVPKLSVLSAGKKLWSIGAMASEARELVGSYISISTLLNPFMLLLGTIAFVSVFIMFFVGITLAFFI